MDALEALTTRRSPAQLKDPAPDESALRAMLGAAVRAPDHGRLKPWRFIVLRGPARERFGQVLVDALKRRQPDIAPQLLERERQKPLRAPLIVVVAARTVDPHKIPVLEQQVAAAAAAQNILVAAHAMGYGTFWRTGEPAYDPHVKEALGLAADDTIIGFIYIGTPGLMPPLAAPELDGVVSEWPAA